MQRLLLRVQFHIARYHGLDIAGRREWPPSPARLFQALVAGAARGSQLSQEDQDALEWLEALKPPVIAAPPVREGHSFTHFMPNNDLDTVGGDPRRIGKIRTATKRFRPNIFEHEAPFLYVWSFDEGVAHPNRICEIALELYQLGRGVDMAWAIGEVLDTGEADARLSVHSGPIYRATETGGGQTLPCPMPGSLKSLVERYEKTRTRFKAIAKRGSGKRQSADQTFYQPPKPRFCKVSYNSAPIRFLYDLRDMTQEANFVAWPHRQAAQLVEMVRNDAAGKLKKAFPEKSEIATRVFGLSRDADKETRIRIIPLPSVGHQYADQHIRRLVIEVPADCPFAANDISWAFSCVESINESTGEILWTLVSAEDRAMLRHYGIGEKQAFRTWSTVTPMVLPVPQPRGRTTGYQRADIENRAAAATIQALRHAGFSARPASIRVQREPFDLNGARAEDFSPGTRFGAARLWHTEITFTQPVSGLIVAGDGRFLGLGLMKPVKRVQGIQAFIVASGAQPNFDSRSVARYLRRAVMALVQTQLGGRRTLPTFFSGHEEDGSPARRDKKSHLAFAFDAPRQRLLVIAPHLLEGRQPIQEESGHLGILDTALAEFSELRAGAGGLLKLRPSTIAEDDDPLFATSTTWMTQTEYRLTRYAKKTTEEEAVIADVQVELLRRGLPRPTSVTVTELSHGPRGGLAAQVKLQFAVAIRGPLMLGRTFSLGGGLFACPK